MLSYVSNLIQVTQKQLKLSLNTRNEGGLRLRKFWFGTFVISLITMIFFIGMFIREKNMRIKLTDQYIESHMTNSSKPPSIEKPKESAVSVDNENFKFDGTDDVLKYEMAAGLAMLVSTISGIGFIIMKKKRTKL